METNQPVVLTPGDPAGIGPDLAVLLATDQAPGNIVIAADRDIIEERARLLKRKPVLHDYLTEPDFPGLKILHIKCPFPAVPGQMDFANAGYVLKTINRSVQGCMEGEFSALITGPVNKAGIQGAERDFTGHTEYLAELTGAAHPVMLLTDGNLRVGLVTTHLPLQKVPQAITKQRVIETVRVTDRDLRQRFAIPSPHIAICGLNPHAGEGGLLGDEEIRHIQPAVEALKEEGINASGPFPADTIFVPGHAAKFDAIVAMFHDQGLPVIKHAAFGNTVNVTLGLPIIRTSVDHGTAYDLAGTGKAKAQSLRSAVSMAQALVRNVSNGTV